MKISPWFLAFILVVSIAAYLLVDKTRVFELFTLRTDQAKCESLYQKCLESGKPNVTCTKEYNACNLGVAATYDTSGNYQALAVAFNSSGSRPYNPNISPPPGYTTIMPNYANSWSSSWPWDNTTSVSKSTDISGSWDTLAKAWDNTMGGISNSNTIHSRYIPSINSVLPTYIPTHPQPSLTAVVPTDAGTGANAILAGATLTPSLRQMIRSDISGTVKKEFDDASSRYQIQYNYQ